MLAQKLSAPDLPFIDIALSDVERCACSLYFDDYTRVCLVDTHVSGYLAKTACDSAYHSLQRQKFTKTFKLFSARLQKNLLSTCCFSTGKTCCTEDGDSGGSSVPSVTQPCVCAEMLVSAYLTSFSSDEVESKPFKRDSVRTMMLA